MLLRVLKRITSLRLDDPEKFCEAEFWDGHQGAPDQALSVYEVDASLATQVYAEHAATAGMHPPRDGAALDVSDAVETGIPRPDARKLWFKLTDEAHVEVLFKTPQAVRAYAAKVLGAAQGRVTSVARNACRDYARQRIAAADPEWVAFVERAPKGESWR